MLRRAGSHTHVFLMCLTRSHMTRCCVFLHTQSVVTLHPCSSQEDKVVVVVVGVSRLVWRLHSQKTPRRDRIRSLPCKACSMAAETGTVGPVASPKNGVSVCAPYPCLQKQWRLYFVADGVMPPEWLWACLTIKGGEPWEVHRCYLQLPSPLGMRASPPICWNPGPASCLVP